MVNVEGSRIRTLKPSLGVSQCPPQGMTPVSFPASLLIVFIRYSAQLSPPTLVSQPSLFHFMISQPQTHLLEATKYTDELVQGPTPFRDICVFIPKRV